jgi:four helix bundle protein
MIWQRSMSLVKDIYELSNLFPKEEIYGLTNQIRRCAISIPSNIAEGLEEIQQVTIKDFYRLR